MLTKEYRVAMPLTVEEYQIGQVSAKSYRFSQKNLVIVIFSHPLISFT